MRMRQIAVAVVIAIEGPDFLVAVDRVVGGVQVQGDPRWRPLAGVLVGVKEQVDEQILDGADVVADAAIAMIQACEPHRVRDTLWGHRGALLP